MTNAMMVFGLFILAVTVTFAYWKLDSYEGKHRKGDNEHTERYRDFYKASKIVRPDFTAEEDSERTGYQGRLGGSEKGSEQDPEEKGTKS